MQLADRWLGFGMIALGAVALTAVATRPCHVRRHHHHARVDLAAHGCSDFERLPTPPSPRPPPPPAPPPPPPAPASYDAVFEDAMPDLSTCLQAGATVQLLVTISPDGRVLYTSPRPDRPTPASDCLAHKLEQLQFPAGDHGVVLRVPFSAP
jgi:hypothetical protein